VAAKIWWASLVLTPVAIAVHYVFNADDTLTFVLACAALVPLAWVIGESTEQVAEHTGPGIGGFVNASFGNAPELIIALFAAGDGLPAVVRGSIAGSVVSNLLLVLGAAIVAARRGEVDRRSSQLQLGIVLVAVVLFLVPSIPGWHGDPERHALYVATIPVAVVLLALYLTTTALNLRRHRSTHSGTAAEDAWDVRVGLAVLAAATVATAFVSELLVHSLDAFADALGLSQFFVAIVIVAIVGNAAEHGGAIVVARRGGMRLAAEIAISSSAQVAVFVAPAIAILSPLVGSGLTLSFRPVEIATMAFAVLAVWLVARRGRTATPEGVALIVLYVLFVAAYYVAGDRV
jgi:Ca2+:H+ antiporter